MDFDDLIFNNSIIPDDFELTDLEITSISDDSRKIKSGGLYVCMPSSKTTTSLFVEDAAIGGARACIVFDEKGIELARKFQIGYAYVADKEKYIQYVAEVTSKFYGDPSKSLKMIGVTGTNGKTSTCWMIKEILSSLGFQSAYMGTLGYCSKVISYDFKNTSPYPVPFYTALDISKRIKQKAVVSEISSHALKERRVWGVSFDVGVYTNISPEHLDFHKGMEDYVASKKILFSEIPKHTKKMYTAVINVDDKFGELWAKELKLPRMITYGKNKGDLQGQLAESTMDHTIMNVSYKGNTELIKIPLAGKFQLENGLAAIGACLALGFNLKKIAQAMPTIEKIPGRFEIVQNSKGVKVVVDYAHTPDALDKILDSAKSLTKGRLITVFGCGGDRDAVKRPVMGEVASKYSDILVLTNDNPRTEDPIMIAEEIKKGIDDKLELHVELDRDSAIRLAIDMAKVNDTIVIAGRGHETHQMVGKDNIELNDAKTAKKYLNA